ncbi:MAG: penicillin-binding protein, partial [Paenibacillus sp.]|nr:penicillin-binding protein [Paenibacillus sp.]
MTEKKNSNRSAGKTSKKKRKSYKKPILIWVLVITVLGIVCALVGYMIILLSGEKHYQMNKDKMEMAEAAVFYDVNQKEVTTMARENRELVTLAEMPDKLPEAFVATEDKRFSEHSGIDFFAIGRALVKDVIHRSAVEGGSTITQQLAKNMFLNADKTIFRKATEASIAIALENHKTKDEILEMYLNRIYFGKSAWGVKAAAKKYFGKSDLKQLALWEMATLAAIPKAPSHYNPLDNPEKSKERRAVVLMLMQEQGYITEQEKAEAAAKDYVAPPVDDKMDYVTFLDYAVSEAVAKSGLTEDELLRGGYRIYTTLEPTAQKAAETAFSNPDFFQKDGPEQIMQAGMTILNNKDGGVV